LNIDRSEKLYQQAKKILPGGVNSPVRAFKGVGGTPLFMERGAGAYLFDVDGNRYVDYILSWGPLVLGHAHPEVVATIQQQAAHGTSFGTPTELESELAQLIIDLIPSVQMLRLVNSGTEATMSVLRLARAFTGRQKIIKFSGCYHGHADMLLVQAGSGVATLGLPDSPGVPPGATENTLSVAYNDLPTVRAHFEQFPDQIAAVIVEPVAGNMGLVLPQAGFLEGLRTLTAQYGALLIFDEVMTGFRVALNGAQGHYNILPDLTALGKVIGGGLPVGAYGGRRDIMEQVAPAGTMYQAGTLSGNPLAMAAGIATLRLWCKNGLFARATQVAIEIRETLASAAQEAGIPLQTAQLGTMFGMFFNDKPVHSYADAKTSDAQRYAAFFHKLLAHGVYFAPSAFEAGFTSLLHEGEALEQTQEAIRAAMKS